MASENESYEFPPERCDLDEVLFSDDAPFTVLLSFNEAEVRQWFEYVAAQNPFLGVVGGEHCLAQLGMHSRCQNFRGESANGFPVARHDFKPPKDYPQRLLNARDIATMKVVMEIKALKVGNE